MEFSTVSVCCSGPWAGPSGSRTSSMATRGEEGLFKPRVLASRASGTQRVQVPSISGVWFQTTLRVWFWEPETSKIGYLHPLGFVEALVFPRLMGPWC